MRQLQRTLIFTFISLCLLSQPGFANSSASGAAPTRVVVEPSFSLQTANDKEMEKLLKENKRCIRCHKVKRKLKNIAAMKMQGAHASEEFYNNCTACHGDKGKHPKNGSTIINFSVQSPTPLKQQNGQCIACHTPAELRQAEWTHDVHYKKINCSSCHQLHEPVDPVININRTARIKLCIDCHSSVDKPQGDQ